MLEVLAQGRAEKFREELGAYEPTCPDYIGVYARWAGGLPEGPRVILGWRKVINGKEYGSAVLVGRDLWKSVRQCEECCQRVVKELAKGGDD